MALDPGTYLKAQPFEGTDKPIAAFAEAQKEKKRLQEKDKAATDKNVEAAMKSINDLADGGYFKDRPELQKERDGIREAVTGKLKSSQGKYNPELDNDLQKRIGTYTEAVNFNKDVEKSAQQWRVDLQKGKDAYDPESVKEIDKFLDLPAKEKREWANKNGGLPILKPKDTFSPEKSLEGIAKALKLNTSKVTYEDPNTGLKTVTDNQSYNNPVVGVENSFNSPGGDRLFKFIQDKFHSIESEDPKKAKEIADRATKLGTTVEVATSLELMSPYMEKEGIKEKSNTYESGNKEGKDKFTISPQLNVPTNISGKMVEEKSGSNIYVNNKGKNINTDQYNKLTESQKEGYTHKTKTSTATAKSRFAMPESPKSNVRINAPDLIDVNTGETIGGVGGTTAKVVSIDELPAVYKDGKWLLANDEIVKNYPKQIKYKRFASIVRAEQQAGVDAQGDPQYIYSKEPNYVDADLVTPQLKQQGITLKESGESPHKISSKASVIPD